MNKAIFLDRDGTLNVDHGYVSTREQFSLVEGAFEALRLLQQKGYKLFIITNQSGVGRGLYTKDDYHNLMKHFSELCRKEHIVIEKVVQCFHDPEEQCACRKPQPQLVHQLAKEFDLDLAHSYVIGDKTSDIQLAHNISAQGILVKTGKAGEDRLYPQASPHLVAENLLDAAQRLPHAN